MYNKYVSIIELYSDTYSTKQNLTITFIFDEYGNISIKVQLNSSAISPIYEIVQLFVCL